MNTPTSSPPPAVAALLANIVHDPCALSLGRPENFEQLRHGQGSFIKIPMIGAGTLRHLENLQTERRLAGSY